MTHGEGSADRIVYQALELSPEGRPAFLETACAGDPELRREAEELLATIEKMDDGFLETPILPLRPVAGPAFDEGRRVGPYRIRAEIGHGGMGRVYLAVRDDDEYEREVALKVLKRGLDTDEIVHRFRHERQILARLDHPNIATLFDGGTTGEGVPYFAMEHVRGEPVDRYCERRGLALGERLELFRKVCEAVHFAHQNLVVHRDLKPGNILVTEDGEPRLLDFGIAKLLDREGTALTVAGMRPMTPEYASPEQSRGEAVTTASDVYSLGGLLYEILAGRRLASPVEARRLGRDLESMVLKAREEEPRHRYASVQQLSDDVTRFLEGLPVLARQATLGYQLGKFVRRHRLGVAMASIMLLLGVVFGAGTTWLWIRAEKERERAEAVTRFLVDLFQRPDPELSKGEEVTARQLLREGVGLVDEELADQPGVRAALMHSMGQAYLGLALYDEAGPLLEESLRLYRTRAATRPERLASCLLDLAAVRRARDRFDEAEGLLREGREILSRKGESPDLARVLNNLAVLANERGDLRAAEDLYREVLAMKLRLLGEEHADVALAKNNLGKVLKDQGKYDEAERLYRESLALRLELHGRRSTEVAGTRNNLAVLLQEKGDLAAAEAMFRHNLELRRDLYGPDHPSVALALNNLAYCLQLQGNHAVAEPVYRQAIAIYSGRLSEESSSVAAVSRNLATLLAAEARYEEAELEARRAVEILRRSFGDGHWRVADAESVLGGCLTALGRLEEAGPLLERSYPLLASTIGEKARQTLEAGRRLDQFLQALARPRD